MVLYFFFCLMDAILNFCYMEIRRILDLKCHASNSKWQNVHFWVNDSLNIKLSINTTQTEQLVWWLESSKSHMCNLIWVIQRTFEIAFICHCQSSFTCVYARETRRLFIIILSVTNAPQRILNLSFCCRMKGEWRRLERLDEERIR